MEVLKLLCISAFGKRAVTMFQHLVNKAILVFGMLLPFLHQSETRRRLL